MELDEKDTRILECLKADASLSTYRISKKISVPQTTVLNRIRKLKQLGIIKQYTVKIDYKKLGINAKALIFVRVNKNLEWNSKISMEETIAKEPFAINVKRLTGKFDFVIEAICKDIDELDNFLLSRIRSHKFISETDTIIVLNEWTHK